MKLIFAGIFLMAAMIAFGVDPERIGVKPQWEINDVLKFQFCYLPDDNIPAAREIVFPMAVFPSEYLPDISNINLANFLSLGFDVPAPKNSWEYNFYLKLYVFPDKVGSENITNNCIVDFGLNVSPYYNILKSYFNDRNNLIVKFAVIGKNNENFTKENPFPQFESTDTPEFQKYFENHVPFYSLYLTPSSEKKEHQSEAVAVNSSMEGVAAFHNELIAGYKKNFRELGGGKDSENYYFLNENYKNKGNSIVVIQIPKKFMSFDNWKELPMPQDPKNVFLTSLLLVYSTEYILKDNVSYRHNSNIPKVRTEEFNKTFRKGKAKVLEVASVINLKELTANPVK